MSEMIICSRCKTTKKRIFLFKRGKKGNAYKGACGYRWNGTICPDCTRNDTKARARIRNHSLPRSEIKDPKWVKGYQAELKAADFFKSMGFNEISVSECNGPDLILTGKTRKYTVEVKSVSYDSRNRWRISEVYPKRKNDDYLCIVFDDGKIIIQPMKYHLRNCTPNGRRSVKDLHFGGYK